MSKVPWPKPALLGGVLAAAASAHADAPPERVPAGPAPVSIHRLDLETWKAAQGYRDPSPGPRRRLVPRTAALARQVHGYHPYWMGASYLAYEWPLLSTIAWFGLELDGGGAVIDAHAWPWEGLVATAHDNGVRVIVTAILHSGAALDALLGSAANRANAVANIVAAVVAGGADGASIDFENVPGSRKQALVAFLGELRAGLDAAVPNAYLSIATPAVDWSNAFDYDELAARCDHLMIMAYDYHWAGSPTTGPVSPLAGWGTYNVGWSIGDYVAWGAPRDKLLLGVPYYGYRWPAASGSAGAATTAPGAALVYSAIVQESAAHGRLWDTPSSTPWYREATPAWRQGWYDDETSLGAKYARVVNENLAGVGVWALGYDGTRPELWAALDAAFRAPTSSSGGTPSVAFRATPNPFRDVVEFRIAGGAAPAVIAIHDVRGRLIRKVTAPGGAVTAWDGRDAGGHQVANGTYVVRFEASAAVQHRRIVRLR